MSIFLHILSAEVPIDSNQMQVSSMHQSNQQFMIREVFCTGHAEKINDRDIAKYLQVEGTTLGDCCSWRGVSCDNGEVTTIMAVGQINRKLWFDLSWMPHTTKYVILRLVVFSKDLSLRDLPRSLRYMSVRNGYPKRVLSLCLSLAALPAHMEEIFFQTNVPFCGTMLIPSLPRNMRLCCIISDAIQKAVVDIAQLPHALKRISIGDGKSKLITVPTQILKKSDPRFNTLSYNDFYEKSVFEKNLMYWPPKNFKIYRIASPNWC